jgi:threonine dehydrogenase-like Zn-dependent dehydrogenase
MDAWREAADLRPAVFFECVGVTGMLLDLMRKAPRGARIVVAGVCMDDDTIRPLLGINKELSLQFVLGYTPGEFMDTLAALADGRIDVAPLVTGRVGVEGVAQAFRDLANPDEHAKILVEPWRS